MVLPYLTPRVDISIPDPRPDCHGSETEILTLGVRQDISILTLLSHIGLYHTCPESVRLMDEYRNSYLGVRITILFKDAGIAVISAKTGTYFVNKYSPLRNIFTPALGRKKDNHSRDRDPRFLGFKLT